MAGDGDLLLLARPHVLGRNVEDAVSVDIEGHLDFRDAAGRRRDAVQVKTAQGAIVRGHFPFALKDVDLDARLAVGRGGENLHLFRRDRRVPTDHPGEHAPEGLDAQGQRGHVEKQDVFDVSRKDGALDGRTDGDDFVRVDALVGLASENLLNERLDAGHPGLAADENHLMDVLGLQAGVRQGLFARSDGPLDQVLDEGFEFRPGYFEQEVLRAGGIGRDERQIDFGLHRRRKLDLRLFRGFLEPLDGHLVLGHVDSGFLFEFGRDPILDALVDIVAAEVSVAVSRFDFDHAFAHFEDGNIERSTSEVIDGDGLVLFLFHPVGQGRGGGFVDDPDHIQAGDLAGILGRFPLAVVEIRGDGDDCLFDFFAEIIFSCFFQLLEDHG